MSQRLLHLASLFESVIREYLKLPDVYVSITSAGQEDEPGRLEEEQIKQAMESHPNWQHRLALMSYLFNAVNGIHDVCRIQSAIVDEDFSREFQEKLVQVLTTIQKLLRIPKNEALAVTESDQEIKLYGCMNCRAGEILLKKVFSDGRMQCNASEEMIAEFVADTFRAWQYDLLLQEHRRLAERLENKEEEASSLLEDNTFLRLELQKHNPSIEVRDKRIAAAMREDLLGDYKQRTPTLLQWFTGECVKPPRPYSEFSDSESDDLPDDETLRAMAEYF